jgi:hypothetical protein
VLVGEKTQTTGTMICACAHADATIIINNDNIFFIYKLS